MLSDVRGQDTGIHYLRRVVDGHLKSPLLLVGEEGVGKRFAVLQTTKEIYCDGTRKDGCQCGQCAQLDAGIHTDFYMLAPDGDKDIGVDAIRDLVSTAGVYPTTAPRKILVIDGADRLTNAAANALLKTLEEPPPTVRFFLLAESPARVIPTIRSRCGLVPFHALPEALILSVLQRFESDPTKALVFARLGDGSVGRAVRYWGSGRLTLRDKTFSLIRLALERDIAGLFSAVDSMEKELPQVLRFLSYILHDLLMIGVDPDRIINLDLREDIVQMSTRSGSEKWYQFSTAVRELREQSRMVKLLLTFQIKTLFAKSFWV